MGNLTSIATVSCSSSFPVTPLFCKTAQPPYNTQWSVNSATRKYRILYCCLQQRGCYRMAGRWRLPMWQSWNARDTQQHVRLHIEFKCGSVGGHTIMDLKSSTKCGKLNKMADQLTCYQVLLVLEKPASPSRTAVSHNGALNSPTGSRLRKLMRWTQHLRM